VRAWATWLLAISLTLISCEERVCEPGSTQRCYCVPSIDVEVKWWQAGAGVRASVEGVQTCSTSGARWQECDCPFSTRSGETPPTAPSTPMPEGFEAGRPRLPPPPVIIPKVPSPLTSQARDAQGRTVQTDPLEQLGGERPDGLFHYRSTDGSVWSCGIAGATLLSRDSSGAGQRIAFIADQDGLLPTLCSTVKSRGGPPG